MMADKQMVSFGIGLLILGLFVLLLPLSPALQMITPFVTFTSKYSIMMQATSAVAIGGAVTLFVLASKKK
jgi:hypothetical protein